MATAIIGAYQAIEAVKLLTGTPTPPHMLRLDFWQPRMHALDLTDARHPDCPCCAHRQFKYLDAPASDATATLCGRDAVQVRSARGTEWSLTALAQRLASAGTVQRTPHFIRCTLRDPTGVRLTVFPDGRSLIHGVTDPGRAKSIHARFVGS
jgi:adenylyltransferase/sulfurtransferase